MPPAKESTITAAIIRELTARGWIVRKYVAYGPGTAVGWPDLMCFKRGRTLFLESKQPGKRTTAAQDMWLAKLREEGFVAAVVHSAAEAVELAALYDRKESSDGTENAVQPDAGGDCQGVRKAPRRATGKKAKRLP